MHIALRVDRDIFDRMLHKGQAEGREVRGPLDHDFVRALYFHHPNGYVVELTAPTGAHGKIMDPKPHEALARWRAIRAARTN
jgi:biotin synthase-related radical SAM superfamily protein